MVREQIREEALQFIVSDGFNNLIMRNLAERLGMTWPAGPVLRIHAAIIKS